MANAEGKQSVAMTSEKKYLAGRDRARYGIRY